MRSKLSRRLVLGGLATLPACQTPRRKFDAEVIILGAGLSGLHAARLLASEGKDVLVLEGSNRIGGRLHTLNHGDMGYTEGGGEQIGANYARIIDTAAQLGINLIPDAPTRRKTAYYFQGNLYSQEAWKAGKFSPFPNAFKGDSPSAPLFKLAAKNNPFNSAEDWLDNRFAKYDISADEFLSDAGLNESAQSVIEHALNGNSLRSYSIMNLYRSLFIFSQSRDMGPSLSVQGGAQRLPEAMAASLNRRVKTAQRVTAINVKPDHVAINIENEKRYTAPYCICALPFGALRNISLNANSSDIQRKAINGLPYTQILQIHLKSKTAFWEKDELPADMWTDLPIERLFANRDHNGNPNGLFRLWINGDGTNHAIWKNPSKISEHITRLLKEARPASEGQFEILAIKDWTTKNPLSGGAYMHWGPSQIHKWANEMGRANKRLAFAGEHLSRLHTGMEGAMESGENAAFYLMDA